MTQSGPEQLQPAWRTVERPAEKTDLDDLFSTSRFQAEAPSEHPSKAEVPGITWRRVHVAILSIAAAVEIRASDCVFLARDLPEEANVTAILQQFRTSANSCSIIRIIIGVVFAQAAP